MKNIIILFLIAISLPNISFSKSTPIPDVISDQGVQDAKIYMDADIDTISIAAQQTSSAQADLEPRQQAILALASQSNPLQSAIDLCNSNPSSYCPGWVVRDASTDVNWDAVAELRASGVNWGDVKNQMPGINWQAVSQINDINWQAIDMSSINWDNWTMAKSNGENWSQFINNGGH